MPFSGFVKVHVISIKINTLPRFGRSTCDSNVFYQQMTPHLGEDTRLFDFLSQRNLDSARYAQIELSGRFLRHTC
jgi:hypothetical protein